MRLPRIFCYARSSTKEQEDSPLCQLDRMRAKCAEMETKEEGRFYKEFSENRSAKEIPWTERPELAKLSKELENGDIVLCWTLSRIDRNPIRMLQFAEYCMNRGVRLFLLKEPFANGSEVELTTSMGWAFLHMGAIFNNFWMEHHREAVKSAIAWRKENGMIYSGKPAPFKVRVYVKVHGKKRDVPMDEWHIPSCELMAECYTRWKYHGESMTSIAKDMNHREAKVASGALLCPTRNKHMPETFHSISLSRFQQHFRRARKIIEENDGSIGPIKVPYYPFGVVRTVTVGGGTFILRDKTKKPKRARTKVQGYKGKFGFAFRNAKE